MLRISTIYLAKKRLLLPKHHWLSWNPFGGGLPCPTSLFQTSSAIETPDMHELLERIPLCIGTVYLCRMFSSTNIYKPVIQLISLFLTNVCFFCLRTSPSVNFLRASRRRHNLWRHGVHRVTELTVAGRDWWMAEASDGPC